MPTPRSWSACVFVSAIPAMYFWYWAHQRQGALKAWRLAPYGWRFPDPHVFRSRPFGGMHIRCFSSGPALPGHGEPGYVNSELIEDDAVRSGQRREATYFASISFVYQTLRPGAQRRILLALAALGFESGR